MRLQPTPEMEALMDHLEALTRCGASGDLVEAVREELGREVDRAFERMSAVTARSY